jgi:hypothetical protein
MSKIVYLFGAGASVGALPMVEEMEEHISRVIDIISDKNLALSVTEKIDNHSVGLFESKRVYQKKLIEELKDLKTICENHWSIDTYAKKLTLARDTKGLKKLKIILSVFFVFEQILNRPNLRYDFFFASIIENIYKLPENIRILTWNYDSQFEIAFSEFSLKKDIAANQKLLKVHIRNKQIDQSKVVGFGIFKINGSTELRYADNSLPEFFFNPKVNYVLDLNLMENIVKMYTEAIHDTSYIPVFTFAWEGEEFEYFWKYMDEQIIDADILIIIGYSLPYFNRSIDRKIISNMKYLSKVYFQSPEATQLIERFKTIRNDLHPDQLIPVNDLKYFFIPNEL